eukprot:3676072-Prymnesium_polylepis.1
MLTEALSRSAVQREANRMLELELAANPGVVQSYCEDTDAVHVTFRPDAIEKSQARLEAFHAEVVAEVANGRIEFWADASRETDDATSVVESVGVGTAAPGYVLIPASADPDAMPVTVSTTAPIHPSALSFERRHQFWEALRSCRGSSDIESWIESR